MKTNSRKMREAQKLGFEVTVLINGEYYEFDDGVDEAMHLCEHCIEAIRSHGDKVYPEANANRCGCCDFCGEEDDLYETYFIAKEEEW